MERVNPVLAVAGAGRQANRASFRVDGLCCGTEARQIEARVGKLGGVTRMGVDVAARRLWVEGDVSPTAVERALLDLGLRGARESASRNGRAEDWAAGHDALVQPVMTWISGILLFAGLLARHGMGLPGIGAAALLLSFAAGGWLVAPRAWRAIQRRELDMHVLMTAAGLGAVGIGEYAEAAAILFLFSLAQLLEARAAERVRRAIRGLMELSPSRATVLHEDGEREIEAARVHVGERVLVRPGGRMPVDGIVVGGASSVNEAPITGESMPVEKLPGAEVFAGTLNGAGALEVRVTRPASDTTLARIIHAVEEAQSSRAPTQQFVERFARIYTPAVLALAAAVFVLPPVLGLGGWLDWGHRALVLMVIACPCALVISTPVTIVSGLTGAARRGILIKGGVHLEALSRIRMVALDKTGTLTTGSPSVAEVVRFDGGDDLELIEIAASAESRSEHPLAGAMLRHAAARGVHPKSPESFVALPGRGIEAQIQGTRVLMGTERLFREQAIWADGVDVWLQRVEDEGLTAVLVSREGRLVGGIAFADRVRPEAATAVAGLRGVGIEEIVVLTGDNPRTGRAVAAGVGADRVLSGLLPVDKVRAVRDLERSGAVAFVGDGVNDAPALAHARVGIAMGVAGTDVALETADVALMGDDLGHLPVAIRLARKVAGIVRQNIAFALLTKLAFVGLAIAGLATLWMAVAADVGASLLVIANGMRALRT